MRTFRTGDPCHRMDDEGVIFPGWICCVCRIYNGYQRATCKTCDHPPCYTVRPGEKLPITRRAEGGRIETGQVDPPPSVHVAASEKA